MHIVIDADVFSTIVNIRERNHAEFQPLIDYVVRGEGVLAYGGTTYGKQLNGHREFREFLVELGRSGKSIEVKKDHVDGVQDFLELNFRGNDHHIVAIVIVKACEIVSSFDLGLHKLIDKCYQPASRQLIRNNCINLGHLKKPKIYQDHTHAKFFR